MRARPLALAATAITLTGLLAACGSTSATSGGATAPAGSTASATSTQALAPGSASDVAFAQMMIPHHQQALEMADLAAKYATSAEVKALADQIRTAQTPEIEQMTSWLTAWDAPTVMPSSSGGDGGMDGMDMGGMGGDSGLMSEADMATLGNARGAAFDRIWLMMMIAHHQSAITMSQQVLTDTTNPAVKTLATAVTVGQATEIATMQKLLASG